MSEVEHELRALYATAANGDPEALDFLVAWHCYCHEVDDQIDEPDRPAPAAVLRCHAQAALLFTAPFAVRHAPAVRLATLAINSGYADSVEFERGADPGLRRYADSLRLCGNEMVLLVAQICGGYDHARRISPVLRKLSWRDQVQAVEVKEVA